jgi:glutathione synthase/RimK-type ligase-like ATP-grasp enzyme
MNILLIFDYKARFGSKWDSFPYRSGLDKTKLKQLFSAHGFECECLNFCNLPSVSDLKGSCVLYTSSEDQGNYYKGFIEDVVLNLERNGIRIIPGYDLLRAHNNKVYMELLRGRVGHLWDDTLDSRVFGSLEGLQKVIDQIEFPVVIKKFDGALSRGVFLAKNKDELIKRVKKISRVKFIKEEVKDQLRPLKHKGYIKESVYRNKFILQKFIPGLKNDWKILVYGQRVFILTRHTRENDFRASGSHCNYLAGSVSKLPEGILDFALKVRDSLNVPHLSLDVVHDDNKFHVVEFQAIYFGTSTVNMSDVFFKKIESEWKQFKNDITIEQLYADGICWFLSQ